MESLDQLIQILETSPLALIKKDPTNSDQITGKPTVEPKPTIMPITTRISSETTSTQRTAVKITPEKINTKRSSPSSASDQAVEETPVTKLPPSPPPPTSILPAVSPNAKPNPLQNLDSSDFAGLLGQLDNLTSLIQTQATTSPSETKPLSPVTSPLLTTQSSTAQDDSTKTARLTSYFMETFSKTVQKQDHEEDEVKLQNLLLDFNLSNILSSPLAGGGTPQVPKVGNVAANDDEDDYEDENHICPGCNESFQMGDTYIMALGKRFHETHLTCCVCHMVLKQVFFEEEGQVFCELHHLEKSLPKCAYCNEFIKDRCVNALGQSFHPEHFFCSQCGVPFNENGYRTFEGKAYCEADYIAFFAPMCASCSKPITSSTINALNKTFHAECFVCADCKKTFRNNVFFPLDQLPYCEFHFHKRNGTLCPSCDKPILGKFMDALGKKWHLEHFVCQSCETSLSKAPFKDISGKPYCVPCYNRFYV